MLKSLEMTEVLDESHLFSREKALRGFKRGAILGSVIATSGIVAATIYMPESMFKAVTEQPAILIPLLGIEAIHAGGWGLTLAFIDSFKPTSRILEHHIDRVLGIRKLLF